MAPAAPGGAYLVRCELRSGDRELLDELRPDHRRYFAGAGPRLVLGGVAGDDPSSPDAITYVIRASSAEDVADFARGDPYGPVYARILVERFHQRVPSGGVDG